MDGCRLVTVVTEVDYRSLMKPSNSRNAWVETTRFQYDAIGNIETKLGSCNGGFDTAPTRSF